MKASKYLPYGKEQPRIEETCARKRLYLGSNGPRRSLHVREGLKHADEQELDDEPKLGIALKLDDELELDEELEHGARLELDDELELDDGLELDDELGHDSD